MNYWRCTPNLTRDEDIERTRQILRALGADLIKSGDAFFLKCDLVQRAAPYITAYFSYIESGTGSDYLEADSDR